MALFKRLFGAKLPQARVEPMRGSGVIQTKEERDATRARMEKEVAEAKARRDSTPDGGV